MLEIIEESDLYKQLGFGDFNVKLVEGEVPEKYKPYVTYDKMSINVRYQSFEVFKLEELIKIDKLSELDHKTGIALMLQIVQVSNYLLDNARSTDIKGIYSNNYLYDMFYNFFGFSKTFIRTCLQVYKTFWQNFYHPLYIEFSFSQLVEMLPLTKADMQKIAPDWSVRKIRSYKKELQDLRKVEEKQKTKKQRIIENNAIEEFKEIETTPTAVSSSYIVDIITQTVSEVMAKCKYAEGSTSYKIFEKGVQALLLNFTDNIKLDNTFIQ